MKHFIVISVEVSSEPSSVMSNDIGPNSFNSLPESVRITIYTFNGSITLRNRSVLLADLGGAFPRGFSLQRCECIDDSNSGFDEMVPFHFCGKSGNNDTNSSLGDILEVSSGYVLTGASGKGSESGKRQVLIQILDPVTGKSLFKGKKRTIISCGKKVTDRGIKWLTNYKDNPTIDRVKTGKLDGDRILVMWERNQIWDDEDKDDGTYYMILSSSGTILKKATMIKGAMLNDNIKIVIHNNCAYWAACDSDGIKVSRLTLPKK